MISAEKLHALGIGSEWSEPLTTTFTTFGINDVNRQAAFIGQCSHECSHFKVLEENLSYSASTLQKLFGHKFGPGEVELYAHNFQKIANRIYGGRMGNRGEESGDGWRFHGRGCIQLTGHDNYWHFGQSIKQDMVSHPELVATPMYAALSAGWFFKTHGCNEIADTQNWERLTKVINGGLFGLDERIKLINQATNILNS